MGDLAGWKKNKIVAFAPETVSIPTTIGIIEHPKHGLVLWDTGVNHVVADPEEGEKYWGLGYGMLWRTRVHSRARN